MIPIVLTAAITPHPSIPGVEDDQATREDAYLQAIATYRKFSKVYFLENSGHAIGRDRDFPPPARDLVYRSMVPVGEPARGKGFLEFQMLDRFVHDDLAEPGFIKITGRYLYENIGDILRCIEGHSPRFDLLIDVYGRRGLAVTRLFYASRALYVARFAGTHQEMDDREGRWAERVLYARLRGFDGYTFFRPVPRLPTTAGPGAGTVDPRKARLKTLLKTAERHVFWGLGAKRLLF